MTLDEIILCLIAILALWLVAMIGKALLFDEGE